MTKLFLLGMMLALSATAFAAEVNKSCDTYMESALGNSSPQVRLELGLKALASAADFNLTPEQEAKLYSKATDFISKNPGKQDEFEKLFYFACTTDLDADEKAQIKDQMFELGEL